MNNDEAMASMSPVEGLKRPNIETRKDDIIVKVNKIEWLFSKLRSRADKNYNNVFIGGLAGLILHGLDPGRDPSDLDIVVFKPNDKQRDFIFDLSDFTVDNGHSSDPKRRSFAFLDPKTGTAVDILVDDERTVPQNALAIKMGPENIPIVPVYMTIEAKLGYKNRFDESAIFREKDIKDIHNLISNTFFSR